MGDNFKNPLTFFCIQCKIKFSKLTEIFMDRYQTAINAIRVLSAEAIDKAKSFGFNLNGAALASDAFFPFADCVEIAHKAGIETFIQPGGSVRDADSIEYCNNNGLAMVFSGLRHFKH